MIQVQTQCISHRFMCMHRWGYNSYSEGSLITDENRFLIDAHDALKWWISP